MVECGDDLDVGAAAQRENKIAGAESRVHAPVGEPGAEGRSDPLDGRDEAVAGHRIGHMIKSHCAIITRQPVQIPTPRPPPRPRPPWI